MTEATFTLYRGSAPLLVSLALKVNSLVGLEQAPNSLALVAGVGAAVAMFTNPFCGKLSDRTSSPLGMRRPWIVGGLVGGTLGVLVVAVAPTIPVVLLGWCVAQVGFNALLAAMVAVLPDQVPVEQRGMVAGVLGVCLPVASVVGTFLVKLFTGNTVAMFLVPCAVAAAFILLFAVTLPDRRLDRGDRPAWSVRELASTFWVSPRRNPDFAWAFTSRFLFVDVAAQRAKQLRRGALPRLDRSAGAGPHKLERVAMEEVRTGLIHYTLPTASEFGPGAKV